MTLPRRRRVARAGAAGLLALALTGCATGGLKKARAADMLRDYDVAVAEYLQVLREHPDNREAQLGLERAKLRASDAHFLRGRQLYGQGRDDDAVVELQLAAELNPTNPDVARDLRAVRLAVRNQLAAPEEGPTALESLLARSRDLPAAGQELPDVRLPESIQTGSQSTSRDVYLMVARLANLSVTFDSAFRDTPAPTSLLRNMTVRAALDAVAAGTNTFYRITAPNTIIVVNNTPAKQREYTEEAARTFIVQNADLKEAMDALRVVSDIRSISPINGINAIVVRDTPERVQAAARFLSTFDKARPELVVDVEVLEVNRTRMQEYGLQPASPGSPGIDGSADVNREGLTLQSLRNLTQADVFVSNIPALYYRLLKTDSQTRTLANPHLRMSDGTAAVANFGEDVPVPRTTFAPIAQGGLDQQPTTSFDYRKIGVNISITPRTHPNDEVTLALNIELSSLAGTGYAGLPAFGTRNVTTTIRLKDGETNILAGLIRDDERVEKQSLPGLGDIPVLGSLFAKNHKDGQQTDVVIMLTPHIIRVLNLTEADLRPLRLSNGAAGAALLEGPGVPGQPIIRDPGDARSAADPVAGADAGGTSAGSGLRLAPLPLRPVPAPPPLRIIKTR